MSDEIKKCTKCGKEEHRQNIVVMKVAFHLLGEASRQVRSRVVGWRCPECTGSSPEWRIPARSRVKTTGVDIPCDSCHGLFSRGDLMVSKAIFYPLGKAGSTLRSRTLSWKCFRLLADGEVDPTCCIAKDSVWNREAYRSTPGWREAEEVDGEDAGIEGGVK